MKRQPTFIDLFSGAGGFSLGLMQGGMKCLAALEYSPMAANTFWANLCLKDWSHLWLDANDEAFEKTAAMFGSGETENVICETPADDWLYAPEISPCMNLFCWDITKLEPEDFCQLGGFEPKDVDVMVGGPPCQGFSYAGERQMDDSRNQLAFRYLEYAKYIQPQFFIIENVPGILSLGKEKH